MVMVPVLARSEVMKILRVAKLVPEGTWLGKHNQKSFPLLLKSCPKAVMDVKKTKARSSVFLICGCIKFSFVMYTFSGNGMLSIGGSLPYKDKRITQVLHKEEGVVKYNT
jgi:hypothetical protein